MVVTIPSSTACNERFFSYLGDVKTFLRSTMGNERLLYLMLMIHEAQLVKNIGVDFLIDQFGSRKNRRYPVLK